ncbi:translation initiation factor IF-2 [Kaistia dalseonensis]|uniref:Translation initiation factor IF-2 n=1 Tax=Kaistia dalseonensis TaxID=410840 RepID=A0ABU0H5A3_9HYPH|nr:translation initiation factor IF-2 [Kaistia dalseonensis]MCX5494914.1 translation initiation factor IF-2 [Kaistia dalseonensis]MDQ0437495.1 translation initiation factor IF-2 [Kaistia dalseonensis]
MNDTSNSGDKDIGGAKKTLSLKGRDLERGTVRQSFSHGRTNTVVVEKKKRVMIPGKADAPATGTAAPATSSAGATAPAAPAPRPTNPQSQTRTIQSTQVPTQTRPTPAPSQQQRSQPSRSGMVLRQLSSDELDARAKALADARIRDAEERRRAEEEAKRRAEEEIRLAKERAEAAIRQAEEDARHAAEAAAKERADAAARRREAENPTPPAPARARTTPTVNESARQTPNVRDPNATEKPTSRTAPPGVTARTPGRPDDEEDRSGGLRPSTTKRPKAVDPKPVKKEDAKPRGRLTLSNALDDSERERSLASVRRRRERERARQMAQGPREKISREVILPETISIGDLANRMAERAVDVIKFLMKQGQMLKATDVIDADMAQLIAEDMGHTVRRVADSDVEEGLFATAEADSELVRRPPVVTIMGHVDHGKTSLLDALRKTNVVSGEAGGITQHIGAYQVELNGEKITFIDTPGHAAFTAMRSRGAKSTDIVVLVVAADDGVMPQTIEAIHHARAAKVPVIVAINKIDKPDADPTRVRTELLQHEIFVESMGGETLDVEVSAKTGENLDKLLETILLQSEVMDLKADPRRVAEGSVIEAKLDKGRGPVATVLVQRGTLHPGDIIVAGSEWGRVRALLNDRGQTVSEAPPSMPVEVLGFQGAPDAGDRFAVVETEARAREIADYRARQKREKIVARQTTARGSLTEMMNQRQSSGLKEFALVIKGDVQGSVEAIAGALDALGTDEVRARIIHSGVGGVTESDVTLAAASNAAIIGFNVRANKQARDVSERDGIEIRYYNIIYDLVDDVKAAMSGLLTPERRETMLGNAQILEIFHISKIGKVAGCRVTDGTVERGANVRLIRENVVIHEGKLSTLKRFKDEVKEVPAGQECGMAFERYEDMRAGDTIECYRVEEIKRSL